MDVTTAVPAVQGIGLATAIMAAWAGSTAFWFGVGGVIWKFFFNPRIKALEAQSEEERRRWERAMEEERRRCDRAMDDMRDRIRDLETMLLLHGPSQLRQQMQAALSEQRVATDKMKRDSE